MRFGVSYFGVRDVRHVSRDLDEIAAAGFGFVVHTVPEYDLRHHEGDLHRIVEATRERGLEVVLDPWGVGGLFGGEAYSELALTEPGCRQVDADGRDVPACCPNAPATLELIRRWSRTASAMGPDRLFWDEPHFYLGALRDRPGAACCRCEHCRRAWAESGGGGDLPPEGETDLDRFRVGALRRFVEAGIGEAAEGIAHTLCLLPAGEFAGAGTDAWEAFADLEGVDRLATDPYWMDRQVDAAAFVRRFAEPLRELCGDHGRSMEVWIQGIRIPAGHEHEIEAGVDAAAAAGADTIAFWSFRGTESMSSLACEDPEAAWAAMKRSVERHGRAR